MPPIDRGVYEPDEEVRVFDGSDEDDDVEGSRLPLLIVLALLVLAMFGGVVWLAYNEGVTRGRTETPVVTAANGPARVAPANPGGTEQPFKGFKIYEQPAPPDDDVAAQAGGTQATANNVTPAAPEKPSPPPATKPAITATPTMPAAKPVETAPASKPVAMAPAPASKPAPAPAKPAPGPVAPATAPPRNLAAATPAAPATKPSAPSAPLVAKPVAEPVKTVAATGSVVLQIGAYKSQADADAAWKIYHAKHTALLDGYNPDVQQADLGDKGTWYRLRIAGFAGKDVASALCERLKADGGACFLGK